jgi:hypothetical protein
VREPREREGDEGAADGVRAVKGVQLVAAICASDGAAGNELFDIDMLS